MISRYAEAAFLVLLLALVTSVNLASAARAEEKRYTMEEAAQLALTDLCTTYIHSTVPDQRFPEFPGMFEAIGRKYGLVAANDVSKEFSRDALPGDHESSTLYTLPTSEGKLLIMVYDEPAPYLCNFYVFGVDGKRISDFVHAHLQADGVPYNLAKEEYNSGGYGRIFRWYEFMAGTIKYSILTEQSLVDYRSAKDADYTFMAYISAGRDTKRPQWVQ